MECGPTPFLLILRGVCLHVLFFPLYYMYACTYIPVFLNIYSHFRMNYTIFASLQWVTVITFMAKLDNRRSHYFLATIFEVLRMAQIWHPDILINPISFILSGKLITRSSVESCIDLRLGQVYFKYQI